MKRFGVVSAIIFVVQLAGHTSFAADGDAVVNFNLGVAAESEGDLEEAYPLFKKACMASDGFADACLAWADLAQGLENAKDVKRALSSAVMLEPENVQARYLLAMMLLKKKDYTWAIEHLEAALPHAKDDWNKSLLYYYLGYALFKNKDFDEAKKQLSHARSGLPVKLHQRCSYYLALIAERQQQKSEWESLMLSTSTGPDPSWADAAMSRLTLSSAFPRRDGFSGQVIASIGINSHPASAFLDDVDSDSLPVLQSVFRADGIFATGGYTNGLRASFTAYREQNWTELGTPETTGTTLDVPSEPGDFNTTLFLPQVAYVRRAWRGDRENQLVFGLDGETQFLDNVPRAEDNYQGSGFGMNGWAIAGKFWWSVATNANTIYAARLKVELRPNYIDENRSSTRYRLRLIGTKYVLNRAIRLKAMVGTRYDRTYASSTIFKYDRLVPELDLNSRWRTPLPRFTVVLGGKLKYNWYMNSRGDAENSFRPQYEGVPGASAELDTAYEEGYYAETRQDFEWELNCELQLALWKKALVALTYRHHQRHSNLDDAPTPLSEPWPGADYSEWERVAAQTFGYVQDIVMLELRQGF